jgi:hypothetical protein
MRIKLYTLLLIILVFLLSCSDELFVDMDNAINNPQMAGGEVQPDGEGGGFIFYDKGTYSDGWRYLEAAPESMEWIDKQWGASGSEITGTATAIGTGLANTIAIVTWLNSNGESDRAAQLCDSLIYNGYSDWFLPSKDELNLMYQNLRVKDIGGFSDNMSYWCSSELLQDYSWSQLFENGYQDSSNPKSSLKYVRAIRAY